MAKEMGVEREQQIRKKWVEREREHVCKERQLREIIKKLSRMNVLLKYLVK